jgi:2-polyprenyl-6-methoxyphenol hydroxylase-like FAD-dependent oxidoreductase
VSKAVSNSVIIAGAGPVGLALACELGSAGVQTVVLERLAEPNGRSPGMAINATVIELLGLRGVMDALRGDGLALPQAHFAQLWLDPGAVAERDCSIFVVPHSVLARRLEERATGLGVDIRRGHEVTAVTQHEDGVVVGVRSGSGERSVDGRYLVGCDGAESAVRRIAGIGFPGTESPFHGIVGDLEVGPGDELFQRMGAHHFPAGLFTVGPSGPGLLRVATGAFGTDPPDPGAPADMAELDELVRRITGTELKTAGTPRWLGRWGDVTRQADRYRDGRVFLAGDAAHVHFPLGGQALGTGIEDAINLGWKLAADIHGWAPPGILDTYHEERHPAGTRACQTTRAQVALMHPMGKVEPLRDIFTELIRFGEVNDYLVKMVAGVDVRYAMAPPGETAHPLVGRRLADVPVAASGDRDAVMRALRAGRGVLLDLTGGTARTARPADAAGWTDRVAVVAAAPAPVVEGPVVEGPVIEGPVIEGPVIEASMLLLRPDGRVAWAAGNGEVPERDTERDKARDQDLRAALETWFGAPSVPAGAKAAS